MDHHVHLGSTRMIQVLVALVRVARSLARMADAIILIATLMSGQMRRPRYA